MPPTLSLAPFLPWVRETCGASIPPAQTTMPCHVPGGRHKAWPERSGSPAAFPLPALPSSTPQPPLPLPPYNCSPPATSLGRKVSDQCTGTKGTKGNGSSYPNDNTQHLYSTYCVPGTILNTSYMNSQQPRRFHILLFSLRSRFLNTNK